MIRIVWPSVSWFDLEVRSYPFCKLASISVCISLVVFSTTCYLSSNGRWWPTRDNFYTIQTMQFKKIYLIKSDYCWKESYFDYFERLVISTVSWIQSMPGCCKQGFIYAYHNLCSPMEISIRIRSGSLLEIWNYLPDVGQLWVPVLLQVHVKFLFQ